MTTFKITGISVSAGSEIYLRISVLDVQGQIIGQVEQHLVASQHVMMFPAPVRVNPNQRVLILFGKTHEVSAGDQVHTFSAETLHLNGGTQIALTAGAALSYRNAPVRSTARRTPCCGPRYRASARPR